jgi:hypothetical protein
VAPGVQVFSCVPPQKTPTGIYDYSYMDGTSMATGKWRWLLILRHEHDPTKRMPFQT